jgi:nucleotide-binding universal stress UspA family protein
VDCDTDYAQNNNPDQAIVRAAETHNCDLIFMASHGRTGLKALVLGSQTRGVLGKSKIPTLVYR